MFKALIAMVESGELDFARTQFFCLDEYAGVTPDDPNSLTGWLFRSFMDPARVPAKISTWFHQARPIRTRQLAPMKLS